ncbi:MAG: MFS transporter, partial [Alphaproteobacteria bacterium]|nr:MFS transporter [Alphaproteobacteria bacterium]
ALGAEAMAGPWQNFGVGLIQAGYPLAAVFTGLVIARVLHGMGWQTLLLDAGLLSLVMLPLSWLVLRDDKAGHKQQARVSEAIAQLFAKEIRSATLLLFATIFLGLMVLFVVVSWITKLSIAAGLSPTNAIYAGALYNSGAFVGTFSMSLLATRIRLTRLIPALFSGAILAMLVFGGVKMAVAETLLVAFMIGVTLQGGFNGVWPLSARLFPEKVRATGIGWVVGVGRAGGIIGPQLMGVLMTTGMPLFFLFMTFCIPLALASFAVVLIGRHSRV